MRRIKNTRRYNPNLSWNIYKLYLEKLSQTRRPMPTSKPTTRAPKPLHGSYPHPNHLQMLPRYQKVNLDIDTSVLTLKSQLQETNQFWSQNRTCGTRAGNSGNDSEKLSQIPFRTYNKKLDTIWATNQLYINGAKNFGNSKMQ